MPTDQAADPTLPTTIQAGDLNHPQLDDPRDKAARLSGTARAKSTLVAYDADWRQFCGWCWAQGLDAFPVAPSTVAHYLVAHKDRVALGTINRRLSSISAVHRVLGAPLDTRSPHIQDVLRDLRREHGIAQREARALTTSDIKQMVATCATNQLADLRDRALILVGSASACRRSELVHLQISDVTVLPEGLRICTARSKTNQEGAGRIIAVCRTGSATCPVAAFLAWVSAAAITEGRVFRSINRHGHVGDDLTAFGLVTILKRRAHLAGIRTTGISVHSLRAGSATSSACPGIEGLCDCSADPPSLDGDARATVRD